MLKLFLLVILLKSARYQSIIKRSMTIYVFCTLMEAILGFSKMAEIGKPTFVKDPYPVQFFQNPSITKKALGVSVKYTQKASKTAASRPSKFGKKRPAYGQRLQSCSVSRKSDGRTHRRTEPNLQDPFG
jgi:hypothetical protein